jgi:hypothetical protein
LVFNGKRQDRSFKHGDDQTISPEVLMKSL